MSKYLRQIIKTFLQSINLFYVFKIIYVKIFFFKTFEDDVYSKSLHVKKIINNEKSFFEKLKNFNKKENYEKD